MFVEQLQHITGTSTHRLVIAAVSYVAGGSPYACAIPQKGYVSSGSFHVNFSFCANSKFTNIHKFFYLLNNSWGQVNNSQLTCSLAALEYKKSVAASDKRPYMGRRLSASTLPLQMVLNQIARLQPCQQQRNPLRRINTPRLQSWHSAKHLPRCQSSCMLSCHNLGHFRNDCRAAQLIYVWCVPVNQLNTASLQPGSLWPNCSHATC